MLSAHMLMWMPLMIYTIGTMPQVLKCWREKSASGVSQIMVYIRSSAVSFYVIYLFACGLPIAYRIMLPIYLSLLLTLAVQGYYFDADDKHRMRMLMGYGISATLIAITSFFAIGNPHVVGMTAGWIAIGFYWTCEIPQVYKNYRRQSVQGFSFLFASMMAVGASMEAMLTLWFGLPKPTLASSIRILSFYTMYCWQFSRYRVVKNQS